MEQIDIRDNFPVMNGGDGVILSKRGDICVGWELILPPAFRCNEAAYDSLVASMAAAIQLLPDYTIVHKQDVFMRKRYAAEHVSSFLEQAYEEHFDGREYLDHKCRLWLCFSSKKNVRNGSSGLLGLSGAGLPSGAEISRCLVAAEQFAAMLGGNGLWELRRLTESEIFGETLRQAQGDSCHAERSEASVGILQDYLNFTDEGADVLSDIQVEPAGIRIGDKKIVCHLFADLDQLPGEVASCKRVSALSTENSVVSLSYLNEIGQALDCEHVVNWFCVKEPLKDIHGGLDSKRRQMQSMSARNAENRKYAEEINEYLETAAVEQMSTVRCHVSVFSTDENATTTAISKLGIVPVRDIANAPAQFWCSIPGNESGLAFSEYMTMELQSVRIDETVVAVTFAQCKHAHARLVELLGIFLPCQDHLNVRFHVHGYVCSHFDELLSVSFTIGAMG